MARPHLLVNTLFCAILTAGCVSNDPGGETQGAATSSTSTTSNNQSGSVTSAPGSATDGTASDSAPTMATATTTGLSTSAGASSTEACLFLSCDDYPKPGCDVFAQDCPVGQKCAAVITDGGGAWNDTQCVEVIGTDKPGDPCTMEDVASGVDSCIKGAMCWEVDMEGIGYCLAQCTGSWEAPVCENNTNCTISGGGELILCIPTCDPLLQDCPGPVNVCYPINDGFACAPDASGDAGQANDPCEFINVCDEGLMCADAALVGMGCAPGSTGCCTPFCNFPNGACPNRDQQCVQYFDPMQLPPNDPDLNIGYCGIPG